MSFRKVGLKRDGGFIAPDCFAEIALGLQRSSEIVVDIRVIGFDGQCSAIAPNRCRQITLGMAHSAQVAMRFEQRRLKRDSRSITFSSALQQFSVVKRDSQLHEAHCVAGAIRTCDSRC